MMLHPATSSVTCVKCPDEKKYEEFNSLDAVNPTKV